MRRATAGERGVPGDGLWTDEPGVPLLALTADCLPVALARRIGPAWPCCTSAGAGCSAGSSRQGLRVLGGGVRAAVGPAIGPCCYEVGPEVAARFDRDLVRGGRLDLWTAVERRAAGSRLRARSSGSTSAPPATPSCSSRTAATASRTAARACSPVSPERIRERYAALREAVGPGVTVVAATKYVSVEELGALAEAGVEVLGENRAQDLEAKHARYGDAFRWHFIGHLQSRKAKVVNATCELCHSLSSESAAARLSIPALVEVNLSGEATKSGHRAGGARRIPRALPGCPRADDDAAARRTTRSRRARTSAVCASSPRRTACASCRWARARTGGSPSRRARR